MPPKPKFTKQEVVEAALDIVSQNGAEALTAREVGAYLGSSSRPIFTVFKNMDELQEAVREAAMKHFESYAKKDFPQMPIFKQIGMKMVLFAVNEPKLYQLLFMQENEAAVCVDDLFSMLGATAELCIETIQQDYGLNITEAKMLFENVWIYTFGVGALCATKFCRFSEEKLSEMLTTEFQAIMHMIKST